MSKSGKEKKNESGSHMDLVVRVCERECFGLGEIIYSEREREINSSAKNGSKHCVKESWKLECFSLRNDLFKSNIILICDII